MGFCAHNVFGVWLLVNMQIRATQLSRNQLLTIFTCLKYSFYFDGLLSEMDTFVTVIIGYKFEDCENKML